MGKVIETVEYFEYKNITELNPEDRILLSHAEQSVETAYAPYSGFSVGSAVFLENNEIVSGSNQENVAYPAGLCAERVALFYASAKYPDVPVKAIAIAARSADFDISKPVTPCGSCRQVGWLNGKIGLERKYG